MGYEVFVFNKYGHEIDFLAQKDGKEYLIQAAYSIAEEKTYQREFALFNTLDQSRRKIIITTDEFDYSTSTVRHVSLTLPILFLKNYFIILNFTKRNRNV
jgi:predicted AAA+ superfamily ATPase